MSSNTMDPQPEILEESALDDFSESSAHERADLSDVVSVYGECEIIDSAAWFTRLDLARPRHGLRCLSKRVRFWKRASDILIAVTLLLLLWPLMLVVAFAVWITSPGPIIFRQTRVGLNERIKKLDRRQNAGNPPDGEERRLPGRDRRRGYPYGKVFTLYKFRTMRTDAEKTGAQFAQKNDPRVTPIGRFLRLTRLDELPQLINILRGEMTLIGPRPERPEFIEELSQKVPNYLNRLGLKPGLTGLAQIVNGYDNDVESFRRKVHYDLLYLQNCCIRNDLKILLRTAGVVLTGKGAL